jgi:very-short-patch-repair endonuclease
MAGKQKTAERKLSGIANRQHGLVTRVQALRAGVSRHEIDRRLENGALIIEYRGVYRVGHRAPSLEARYLAAVLACGENALLCGLAAGHLLGLVKGRPPPPEVVAPTQRHVPGLKTRHSRSLGQADGTTWRGIPVTTVPRTLVDLAGELGTDALARACHEAGVRHGTTPAQVDAVLARRPNAPGATKLRRILRGEIRVTLSTLERRFLARLRQAGLPLPQTNRPAGGRRVDCRWPAQRLTVELDGYRYHASRHAWELDRRREREARSRGDEFRRYTWSDVVEAPAFMLEDLRVLLGVRPRAPARSPARAGSWAERR